MSRVMLIAADKPLPLCDRQEERTKIVKLPDIAALGEMRGKEMSVTIVEGFKVEEHSYYRSAVDALGHSMKPYPYELHLEHCQTDLNHLKAYLSEHFLPGETVELWNLWVGIDRDEGLPHYQGRLCNFDMDTLAQFLDPPALEDGQPIHCRMTVTI